MSDPTTPPEEPVVPAATPVEPPAAPPVAPPVAEPAAVATPAPADPYAQPAGYTQPAYQQPQYAQQPYVAGPKTNVLAIVSLVLSLVSISIGGVITGHIALNQIKKNGEGGRGLALAGLIVGYVGCLGWLLFWLSIILSVVIGGAGLWGLYGMSDYYSSY